MSLRQTLSGFWRSIQGDLFPWLEEELGPLGERYRRFVTCLSLRGCVFSLGWSVQWGTVPPG